MKHRVVITGMGAVTPTGNTVEEFWNSIKEGKVGIGPITKFDASGYKASLAAEVKGFDPRNTIDVYKRQLQHLPFGVHSRIHPYGEGTEPVPESYKDLRRLRKTHVLPEKRGGHI